MKLNLRSLIPLIMASLISSSLLVTSQSASSLTSIEVSADAAKKKETKEERKKRLNPQISPSPSWPPKGFKETNGIYAKIPTKRELMGLVSNSKRLFEEIKACYGFACGSVIVTSYEQCLWWEVLSTVTGPKKSDTATITSYGSLTTKSSGTKPQEQRTILLVSSEPIAERVRVANITVTCHRSGKKGKSGNSYLPYPNRD